MDEPDDRASRCRLGTYRERPCGRSATKKCDEFPPLHGLPRAGTARRIIISQIEEVCRESRSGGLPLMVRFGSKADIARCQADVRFTPESGHWLSIVRMSAFRQQCSYRATDFAFSLARSVSSLASNRNSA